jgi:hypothetical protein
MPPSLAHLYQWIGENFEQRIWDKMRCFWEDPWETHCEREEHHDEPIRNLRNIREQVGNTIFLKFHPHSPPLQRKKKEPFSVYILLFHWLHAYSIGRHGCHHFVGSKNTPSTKHTIHIMCPNLMVLGSLSTHLHLLNSHLIILWKLITNYCLNLPRYTCHYGSNTKMKNKTSSNFLTVHKQVSFTIHPFSLLNFCSKRE